MSLIDDVFGLIGNTGDTSSSNQSGSKQSQEEQTLANTSSQTVGNTGTQGKQGSTTAQTSQQTGEQTQTSLDPAVQALVTSLLSGAAGGVNAGNSGPNSNESIVSKLIASANTPAVSAADIAGEQSAAKTSFAQGEAVNIGQLKQQIGSVTNTYAAQLDQKGQQDLAATLAGIVANAGATNKAAQLQALSAALGGNNSNSSTFLALVDALKGANVTSQSASGSSGLTQEDINTLQNIFSNSTTNTGSNETKSGIAVGSSNSNTQGSENTGLFSLF